MSSYKQKALDYLKTNALADKKAAEASLEIMLEHPAGIGDHSTGDLYDNLNEALAKLADAEDRLETLKRHYGEGCGEGCTGDC